MLLPVRIQTLPAKDVALQLHQRIPGIQITSAGTNLPPEHRTFGTDDDVLERGEVLQVVDKNGQRVRVLVSKAVGFPGERIAVLPDHAGDAETQQFAVTVEKALDAESTDSQKQE